ncbi:type VII secretion-associated serine protease mycosin [Thermocatellispora tengchongensis]|uniref:Type VII secretion-associated serine protease mycosin n=1 Tax=Thermocatellispora tengchongensis TaxID=1073253 RepID=A0A840P4G1_9ACTN|nr:S8 family serine peptidase [Thermocatellispora tengchongensis]MBB5133889.1 type VII secretion-associated serine protease mycosin [Thermocatellispora tengchongensis]
MALKAVRCGLALLLAGATAATGMLAAPPAAADDVRASQLPVLRTLQVAKAWPTSRGEGVLVAVLDSGVDPTHRDLAGSVRVGRDFTEGANPPGVEPRRLHGTYMASLIAGHGHGPGNGDGIIGVAPKARILSVRVILEDEEPGFRVFNSAERYENVVAEGIRYAVDQGADVINMSISKELATKEERAAVRYAIGKGVVLVAAAGNDGAGEPGPDGFAPYSYPAAFPGVVSVGAADRGLRRATFSNFNPSVLVAAPGVDILGAGPNDEYWVGRGTSQASALVSGVAALIKAKYPDMSPPLVVQALTAGASKRPSAGYDTGMGFGVVNAAGALAEAARISRHTLRAGGKTAADPARPVAAAPAGPVQVVHRDRRVITIYTGVSAAATVGALSCVVVIALIATRVRRASAAALDAPLDLPPRRSLDAPPHAGPPTNRDVPLHGDLDVPSHMALDASPHAPLDVRPHGVLDAPPHGALDMSPHTAPYAGLEAPPHATPDMPPHAAPSMNRDVPAHAAPSGAGSPDGPEPAAPRHVSPFAPHPFAPREAAVPRERRARHRRTGNPYPADSDIWGDSDR